MTSKSDPDARVQALLEEVASLKRTVQELEDWNGADFAGPKSDADSSALQSTIDSLSSRNRQLESDLQRLQVQQRNDQLALERLDECEETIAQLQEQLEQERANKKKPPTSNDSDAQRLLAEERKRCEELSRLLDATRQETDEQVALAERHLRETFDRERAVLEQQIQNDKAEQVKEHESRAKELNLREMLERQLIELNEEVQSLENDKAELSQQAEDLRQQLQSRESQIQTIQSTAATPGSPPMLASSSSSPTSQLAPIYDQLAALLPDEFSLSDNHASSSLADRFANLVEHFSAYLGTFSIIQEELDSLKQILNEKHDELEKLRAHLQEQQSAPQKAQFYESDEEELEEILDFHQRAPSRQSVTPGEKQQLIAQNEVLSALLTEKEQELVVLQQAEKTREETVESLRLNVQQLEVDKEARLGELNDIRNVLDEKLRENSSLKKEKMYFIEKLAELERERLAIVHIAPKQTSPDRERSPAPVTPNVEGVATQEQFDKLRASYDELLELSQRQHDESLSYYNEYTRIVGLYNELNGKHSQLQVDYESVQSLIQQKNEAYLQCQNELNTFQNLLYQQKKKSDDVEALTTTLSERDSQLQQLSRHEAELLGQLTALQTRANVAEEEAVRLTSKQQIFDQMQLDLKRATHERDLAVVEKKQLENETGATRDKLVRLEESERTLTSEVDRLRHLLQSHQELVNELESLRNQSEATQKHDPNEHLLQCQDSLGEQIATSARLTNENNELRQHLDNYHHMLQNKDLLIGQLQHDVAAKTQQLVDFHEGFQTTNSTRVEKQLVKSILLSYFQTPIDKQQEVVPILSALVGFTQEEYDRAMSAIANNYNNSTGSSWLAGWLGGNPIRARVPTDMPAYHPDKSFAELLIQYVDHQSTTTEATDACNSTSADKQSNDEADRSAVDPTPSTSVDKVLTI